MITNYSYEYPNQESKPSDYAKKEYEKTIDKSLANFIKRNNEAIARGKEKATTPNTGKKYFLPAFKRKIS